MATLKQRVNENKFKNKKIIKKRKKNALNGCPQKRGVCLLIETMSPKKPNSANRRITKIKLTNQRTVRAYITGESSKEVNKLMKFSSVLVRGGSSKDLPGIKYKIVRGALDSKGLRNRVTSRSKYGTRKSKR